ncbi:MAG: DUF2269 domain-containing protein [Chromatiales bacterium]|jgi:uncharacterized membrane protein
MDSYPLLKLVHILSATLLFGTGLGSAFYLWRAHLSGDVPAIARVARDVVLADWLFTSPAILAQLATGLALVRLTNWSLDRPWILLSIALFALAGVCWLPVVWIQIRVRALAAGAVARGSSLPEEYARLMRFWFLLGWPAFGAVLAIFVLMVYKPPLW